MINFDDACSGKSRKNWTKYLQKRKAVLQTWWTPCQPSKHRSDKSLQCGMNIWKSLLIIRRGPAELLIQTILLYYHMRFFRFRHAPLPHGPSRIVGSESVSRHVHYLKDESAEQRDKPPTPITPICTTTPFTPMTPDTTSNSPCDSSVPY